MRRMYKSEREISRPHTTHTHAKRGESGRVSSHLNMEGEGGFSPTAGSLLERELIKAGMSKRGGKGGGGLSRKTLFDVDVIESIQSPREFRSGSGRVGGEGSDADVEAMLVATSPYATKKMREVRHL
uniref:Uncharacterized protein n=1 Tax=Palpitomonas bilix TaxID=652834 RepID=A0A7S3CX21_9EUKA